jgi:prophage antirepressor-like protein
MKSEIKVFKSEMFGQIRTMVNEKGETFFVAKDVTDALGYRNASDAIAKHVDAEDRDNIAICDSIGRARRAMVINESGLYALILSSKLDKAREFKHWVTAEVLPAIRRTGRYELLPAELKQLGDKADYCDRVLLSTDCMSTAKVANEMGMSGPSLLCWLISFGVIYKKGDDYMLYADYARQGVAKTRTDYRRTRLGTVRTTHLPVWTEAGRKFIHDIMSL